MFRENRQNAENGSKREQILLAAVEMFLEKDYYQVRITEIAERAGVGKGTVYEYFSSKEDLFKDSISYCADSYLQLFSQTLSETSSVQETVENIVKTHLELIKENKNKLHLLFNERPLNFQEMQIWVTEKRDELLKGVSELFKEGIKRREIRSDIDVEMAGRLFLALNCVVMGGMVIIDDIDVDESQLENLLDIFWRGVAGRPENI